eukprot:TRINITY_DN6016_c0_g1_i4.p1 TRINITY_DN6016_c0_g1~~TRINITY_DN6016_c0_g1_i4.p1  ORF type:complete len:319 (-),score=91.45 TRINITY_DN6016_c0_g1_i4:136-1092(-)
MNRLVTMNEEKEAPEEVASNLSKYVVDLEDCGPFEIFVEGDLDKLRDSSNVFLTVHDIGSSYLRWVQFTKHEDMIGIRARSLFLHVSICGQAPGAEAIKEDFPSMQEIGLNLVTILDQLRIQRVVALGDGAGAYLAARFAMCHPNRVHGVILINSSATTGSMPFKGDLKEKLVKEDDGKPEVNLRNATKFGEAFRRRADITGQISTKISFDTLLISGMRSKSVKESEEIHKLVKPGVSSLIKLDDVEDVLEEAPEKLADSVILFCQGLGLMPTAKRRSSRSVSISSQGNGERMANRRMSMEQYDVPNVRRLSLTVATQ